MYKTGLSARPAHRFRDQSTLSERHKKRSNDVKHIGEPQTFLYPEHDSMKSCFCRISAIKSLSQFTGIPYAT
ncbi:hypothetical protein GCM10010946_10340 [Undibacterium squillarum]|uniref:Uncharacterized protein n=1 Tax=Undibacterium squillarum TaxID=1131567 RepID=A0ABQ2XWE7_9BURK|nr:hypothetical protein GCM10010946_10340 [Undibacterium squillarum]